MNNVWKEAKGNGRFLFPVKALSKVFRAKFIELFKQFANEHGMEYSSSLHKQLYKKPWVVYSKPPFGGVNGVIRYLARYTPNIAISYHRIKNYSESHVTSRYVDYRHSNQKKYMP